MTIAAVAWSKASIILDRSNNGLVGSNLIQAYIYIYIYIYTYIYECKSIIKLQMDIELKQTRVLI
jgi:hypothetical protein